MLIIIMLSIHKNIVEKLDNFIKNNQVPHIIFHGPCGSGKKTIVCDFLSHIYGNEYNKKNFIMYVDCAMGKGIKFVREDIKFFAKTNSNIHGIPFKSIVFTNADKLTTDAQSALRRCIELFSHSTRFFIIIEDKYKLLKPICSRFCEIFINLPLVDNKILNLHQYNIDKIFDNKDIKKRKDIINKTFNTINDLKNENKKIDYISYCEILYTKGISGLDIISYLEKSKLLDNNKFQLITFLHNVKKEFRNEKTFIFFIFTIIFLRNNVPLENISFM
jgi:DNA polymerase III delta prime subunit